MPTRQRAELHPAHNPFPWAEDCVLTSEPSPNPFASLAATPLKALNRRRPPKTTSALSREDFMTLYRALAFANVKGLVMNTFTTIAWSPWGCVGDLEVDEAQRAFIVCLRHWLYDNNLPVAIAWTKERGDRHGLHSHVLAHIPDHMQRAYRLWAKGALERRSGKKLVRPTWREASSKSATLHISPIRKAKMVTGNQWELFHYMTKGVDEAAIAKVLKATHSDYLAAEFRQARLSPQGMITGRRCGVSRSLDKGAQNALDASEGLPIQWPKGRLRKDSLLFDDTYLDQAWAYRLRADLPAMLQSLDV